MPAGSTVSNGQLLYLLPSALTGERISCSRRRMALRVCISERAAISKGVAAAGQDGPGNGSLLRSTGERGRLRRVATNTPVGRRFRVDDIPNAEHALLDRLVQRRRLPLEARVHKDQAVLLHARKHAVPSSRGASDAEYIYTHACVHPHSPHSHARAFARSPPPARARKEHYP